MLLLAAEVVRSAANTDINTIFGSVINENLSDEVIVTVIATGFEKEKVVKEEDKPVYSNVSQSTRRTRVEPENSYQSSEILVSTDETDDSDEGFDLPPFLKERNY